MSHEVGEPTPEEPGYWLPLLEAVGFGSTSDIGLFHFERVSVAVLTSGIELLPPDLRALRADMKPTWDEVLAAGGAIDGLLVGGFASRRRMVIAGSDYLDVAVWVDAVQCRWSDRLVAATHLPLRDADEGPDVDGDVSGASDDDVVAWWWD